MSKQGPRPGEPVRYGKYALPQAAIAEITDDARFTGGRLVLTRRHYLLAGSPSTA